MSHQQYSWFNLSALFAVLLGASACGDITAPLPTAPDAARADAGPGTGDLYVMLQTDPHGATAVFSFTHDVGPNSSPQVPSPFTLSDGQLAIFNAITAGSYSLSLVPQTGWKLAASGDGYDTGCWDDQGNSTIDLTSAVASISIGAGEFVVCTFVLAEDMDPPDEPSEPSEPDEPADPPAPAAPPVAPRGVGYWKQAAGCASPGKSPQTTVNLFANPGIYPLGTLDSMTCSAVSNLLSKNDVNGNARPGDAAYHLASQLLAARLNVLAGSIAPDCIDSAMSAAQQLLAAIGFTGTGDYLGPRSAAKALRSQASALAELLGRYNDGDPAVCS